MLKRTGLKLIKLKIWLRIGRLAKEAKIGILLSKSSERLLIGPNDYNMHAKNTQKRKQHSKLKHTDYI